MKICCSYTSRRSICNIMLVLKCPCTPLKALFSVLLIFMLSTGLGSCHGPFTRVLLPGLIGALWDPLLEQKVWRAWRGGNCWIICYGFPLHTGEILEDLLSIPCQMPWVLWMSMAAEGIQHHQTKLCSSVWLGLVWGAPWHPQSLFSSSKKVHPGIFLGWRWQGDSSCCGAESMTKK